MEEKDKGLKEKVDEIHSALQPKQKDKKEKLPLVIKRAQRVKLKKNKVLVWYIKANRELQIHYPAIEDGIYKVGELNHEADMDRMMFFKNKVPCFIQPEWDIKPYSPKDTYAQVVETGRSTDPQRILIRAMKKEQVSAMKKGFGNIIWIVIGVIVILYLIFG